MPRHAANQGAKNVPRSPGGFISINEIYRIEEAKARMGWTDSSLRAAKSRGRRLLKCGKRVYVSGEEIRRFLESS